MKRNWFYIVILVILGFQAHSQSLSVFDIDTTSFPTMKAKFYAFDASGKQISSLNPSDFDLMEDGVNRQILSVNCPEQKPLIPVSVATSIDVSGSMSYSNTGIIPVELGKITARELCNSVQMPPSEFALQTCHAISSIHQDFTTHRALILNKILPVIAGGDNDFVEQLLNPRTGLLNIAKSGKYKRVAVIYTDAWWYALSSNQFQRCIDTCLKYDIQFYAVIYSRPEAELNGIKMSLKELSESTGGHFYDGITEKQAAIDIAFRIQSTSQGGDPCTIEWESGVRCTEDLVNVKLKLKSLNLTSVASYQSPNPSVAKLEIKPASVKFIKAIPGVKRDTTITITARNSDFTITNITSSNPSFMINPTNFLLKSGQSINLTLSFVPADSGYVFTRFDILNDLCIMKFTASGGFPGKKPTIKTIKLINPNGGETLVVGLDTVITWEGVLPEEKVKIEYSTNNGAIWKKIADSVSGLSYFWRVPKTPSNQCLARVTAKSLYADDCSAVKICNQLWMGCNLDVDTYRNGDSIPEVTDPTAWLKLTTGAWCYYNNDPANELIYGKLYNWFAVNDPRGLAPEGWHVPSDSEWTELATCLGGSSVAGGKLKSTGTKEAGDGLWLSPNTGATNESGFTAHPGGYRYFMGSTFFDIGNWGYWWTSTQSNSTNAWYFRLESLSEDMFRNDFNKGHAFSVRCVRD